MKAGIVTITNGVNYGNRLQNYAVQEALGDMGIYAETIWKTTNVFDIENPGYVRKLRLKKLLHYHLTSEEARRLNFHDFNKKYIRRSLYTIDQNVPEKLDAAYDCFIAGSDQVWNPFLDYCTEANFLTFTSPDKKVAFSPSIAVQEIPDDRKGDFRKWIGDFRLLSVREKSGQELIWELCGRKAEVLGDPTFCLTAERWRKIEKKPANIPKAYILVYFLGTCIPEYRKAVEQYAKTLKKEAFWLQEEPYYSLAPDEFLYLIDHAACVCTDSFHGTVFSLLFHTPFIVFGRRENFKDMSSRLDTLLELFAMGYRKYERLSEGELLTVDFSSVDEVFERERTKIREFLARINEGD